MAQTINLESKLFEEILENINNIDFSKANQLEKETMGIKNIGQKFKKWASILTAGAMITGAAANPAFSEENKTNQDNKQVIAYDVNKHGISYSVLNSGIRQNPSDAIKDLYCLIEHEDFANYLSNALDDVKTTPPNNNIQQTANDFTGLSSGNYKSNKPLYEQISKNKITEWDWKNNPALPILLAEINDGNSKTVIREMFGHNSRGSPMMNFTKAMTTYKDAYINKNINLNYNEAINTIYKPMINTMFTKLGLNQNQINNFLSIEDSNIEEKAKFYSQNNIAEKIEKIPKRDAHLVAASAYFTTMTYQKFNDMKNAKFFFQNFSNKIYQEKDIVYRDHNNTLFIKPKLYANNK